MSKTVQNTIDWAAPFIRYMPLTSGVNNEPAMSNANIVQQTVLGAPFCWPWNRTTCTFSTVAGTQDYVQSLSNFGFIEKAVVTDINSKTVEITERDVLSQDSRPGRPDFIAAQNDDLSGNITFRLMKVPDQVYQVIVTYQKKAPLLAILSDTWAVPDWYQYIVDYGFLSLAFLHADDPRVTVYNQKFVAGLLSANRGLSDLEKNIFVGNWMALNRQETTESIKSSQAVQARGV